MQNANDRNDDLVRAKSLLREFVAEMKAKLELEDPKHWLTADLEEAEKLLENLETDLDAERIKEVIYWFLY